MGKILDIITILFKGDTTDLEKKKKEAIKTSEEVNDALKDQKSNVEAVGNALDMNIKKLENTLQASSAIDQSLAQVSQKLASTAATAEPFPVVEKARKQTEQINKNLEVTKKGAEAVEGALKSVVKQFAGAALGAFTVSKLIGEFKGVAVGALGEAQFSRNLGVDIEKIDALGQALKEVNGTAEDVQGSLAGLSQRTGLYGTALFKTFNELLRQYRSTTKGSAQLAFAQFLQDEFGYSPKLLAAEKLPDFQKNVDNIESQNKAIDKTKDSVLALNTAWAGFTTEVRKSALDLVNALAPIGTFLLKLQTNILKENPFKAYNLGYGSSVSDVAKNSQQAAQNFNLTLPPSSRLSQAVGGSISLNVDTINVNAPNATDANGISGAITDSFSKHIDILRNYYNDGKVA